MAGTSFTLEAKDLDRLVAAIKDYGDGAEKVVNDVFHGFGAERISEEARERINPSGRKWAGKKKGAKDTQPFTSKDGNLSVTVLTKSAYHYLYFPDDGSNTVNHIGQQHFMREGGKAAKNDIIDRCLAQLSEI